jgi:16S rRNA (uracil1498-N3)-methyltransferase
LLQSKQSWLPVLHEPVRFEDLLMRGFEDYKKFIANCEKSGNKINLSTTKPLSHSTLLISAEGGSSKVEINITLESNFVLVSHGETRLRTETAGVVAAAWLTILYK